MKIKEHILINPILCFAGFLFLTLASIEMSFTMRFPFSNLLFFALIIISTILINPIILKKTTLLENKKYFFIILSLIIFNTINIVILNSEQSNLSIIKKILLSNSQLTLFTLGIFICFFTSKYSNLKIILSFLIFGSITFIILNLSYDVFKTLNINLINTSPDTFYGLSSEPFRHAQIITLTVLILIIFNNELKKFIKKKYFYVLSISSLALLIIFYSTSDTFAYQLVILLLGFLIVPYLKEKIYFVFFPLFFLSSYIIILSTLSEKELFSIFDYYGIVNNTVVLGILNHYFSIHNFLDCGMLGCGFALKPNQYLFDLSTQQNKFDTSLVLHDSGSIFFRLIRDLGLIGILFFFKATLLISYFTIKSNNKNEYGKIFLN